MVPPPAHLAREGLFTASYIAPCLLTTARAPTLARGSWHLRARQSIPKMPEDSLNHPGALKEVQI